MQHGTNVNIFSLYHGTPLYDACTGNGDDAATQLLLKHGGDVNSKGSKRETLFTSILSQNDRYLSERLIDSLLETLFSRLSSS
jgi:ankyrin repeat protein